MDQSLKKLDDFFRRMASDNSETAELIEQFRKAVLLFGEMPALGSVPQVPALDESLFNQGKPLYAVDDWDLSALELPEAVNFIIPRLIELMPDQKDNLKNLQKVAADDPAIIPTLTLWLLKRDDAKLMEFAEQNKIEINTLLYVLQNVFQARAGEIGKAASQKSGADFANWKHGHCPVCGSPASFSYLQGEGGSRHLTCTVCRLHWRYTRNACPYCGVDKPNNIVLYYVEENSGHKAEACVSCKRYILSADLRKNPEDVDFAHFLPYAMIPLDILMNEKEFVPGAGG